VLIGYLSSLVGGLVIMFLQIAANGAIGAVIIPSMIIHFFLGATSAVIANASGGWKAAVLGGFMNGVAFTLLAGPAYIALGKLGFSNSTFGDTGFGIMANMLAFFDSIAPLQ
jgi:PTS system ascorbate-specific IIC component